MVFTCPADRTAIVKDLRIFVTANTAAGTTQLQLDVLLAGVTARSVWRGAVGAGTVGDFSGSVPATPPWIVLQETDVLRFTVPANVTAQCYASGTLLSGDPA